MELRQYCRHIADIAEVLLHQSTGVFGLTSAPLPVGVALQCLIALEGEESLLGQMEMGMPEKQRLLRLLEEDQTRTGGLRNFLSSSMKDRELL